MNRRRCLSVDFTDFWPGFIKEDNIFISFLRRNYRVSISSAPDVLFYSCFGSSYMSYSCPKIFFSAERRSANFLECDYAFTFDQLANERHSRLPLYVLRGVERLALPKPCPELTLAQKKHFCCFVVSDPRCVARNNFFLELSKYKKVDSGGRFMNNIGGPVPYLVDGVSGKLKFIRDYKFVISFENQSYPGYTTEKIVEPMLVNSVPIYWGNPQITEEFNRNSFVNCHDYETFDAVIQRVIDLDQNDESFVEMLRQPWFIGNVPPEHVKFKVVREQIERVVDFLLQSRFG